MDPSPNGTNESEFSEIPILVDHSNVSDLNDSTATLFTDIEFDTISKELEDLEAMSETDREKTESNQIGILDESKERCEKIDGVIENIISGFFDLSANIETNMKLVAPFPDGVEREDPVENEINENKTFLNSDLNVSFRNQNESENQQFQNMILQPDHSDETLIIRNEGVEKIELLENNLIETKLVKDETVFSSKKKRKLDCILDNNRELIENKEESSIQAVSEEQSPEKKLISFDAQTPKMCEVESVSDINPPKNINIGVTVKDESLQENEDNEGEICPTVPSPTSESNNVTLENISTNSDDKGKNEEEKNTATTDEANLKKEDQVTYFQHYSNPFEIVVPLIGTSLSSSIGEIKPFAHRYDLARERNRLRAQNEDFPVPTMSYEEYRKQRDSRSQEEVEAEVRTHKFESMQVATYLTRIAIKILRELQKDDPSEEYIEKYFGKFQNVSASSLALVYAPHFVHTVMFCRGCTDFSARLRSIADDVYSDCHAMFPIPHGYNFETVYASELKKNLPDEYEGISEIIPDYGDYECPSSDSEDSAFYDDNDNSN